jgi:PAS domain S-box-containing protein
MIIKKFLQMLFLVSAMVGLSLVIGLSIFNTKYFNAMSASLSDRTKSQARLLEAIHRRLKNSTEVIRTFSEYRNQVALSNRTLEIILFRVTADNHVEFLYDRRGNQAGEQGVTSYSLVYITPFWLATKGNSGTLVDKDHHGVKVLAAYEPVKGLDWYLVMKIDYQELQEPYRAAVTTSLILAFLFVLAGTPLLFQITHPLLKTSQENEKKFRTLFMSGTDAAYLCEVSREGIPGPFLEVNDSARRMLGYFREEFMRMTLLGISPPDKAMEFSGLIERFLKEKDLRFEWTHVAKDGRRVPVEVSSHCFELNGRSMVLSVAHDITTRKRSESRIQMLMDLLNRQNEQLKKLDEMKDEFLSMSTHELRTPLTSIKGYLQLLLGGMGGELSNQQRDFVQTALNNSNRLYELVNDLLDLSRLESGRIRMNRTPLPVESLLKESMAVVKNLADQKGVTLRLVSLGGTVTANVDGQQMERMLINLLSNAVKFTSSGGTIEAGVEEDQRDGGSSWHWWVKDSGSGIPADALDKVFDKFYQVESLNTRSMGGTGLGLAICKGIAEAHGGTIRVESKPGEGATFHVFIPDGPDLTPSGPS